MIERIISHRESATPAALNPIYKLVSILLILNNYCKDNRSSIGRLQVYLWGLSGLDNLKKLKSYKEYKYIDEVPFSYDSSLFQLITEAEERLWITTIKDGGSYSKIELKMAGIVIVQEMGEIPLFKDILNRLNEIGMIPDTYIKNLKYNWKNDLF